MSLGDLFRALAIWPVLLGLLGAARPGAAAPAKPVLVYYMPWYAAPPFSRDWGWHWTMDHFHPDQVNASGDREVASWYYPLIGPYDSGDPVVLEYHVLLMKLAGVDGVVVDWYGSADYFDYAAVNQNTLRLFDYTRKAGLKFAICYEDQTIQRLIEGHRLTPAGVIPQAQQDLRYLQEHFFRDPSYFRFQGKPLLENFGPQYFQASTNWDAIFSGLEPSNRPALFTEDNRLAAGLGAFDWPPMWLSQQPGAAGVLSEAALQKYLLDFERKAGEWPAFVSSAFPRFHDIYQRAGVRDYWGYLGDREGETFRATLERAWTNSSAVVQVVTWNDFGEGTTIEPTKEYGFRDLAQLQAMCLRQRAPERRTLTNELAAAVEFFQLRRRSATNAPLAAGLDQVFADFVAGRETNALPALRQMEAQYR